MNEIWKDIENFEGLYQVSNLGRVKSLYDGNHEIFREKILTPGKNGKGYQSVNLYKAGNCKRMSVHRLVGKAFVQGWFEGAVINHKDHRQSNNVYTNLEWTTQKNNCSREKSFGPELTAIRNKKLFTNGICSKKVMQYTKDGTFVKEWQSTNEVERQLGFDQGHICLVCNGHRKSAYGFCWKYSQESNNVG